MSSSLPSTKALIDKCAELRSIALLIYCIALVLLKKDMTQGRTRYSN